MFLTFVLGRKFVSIHLKEGELESRTRRKYSLTSNYIEGGAKVLLSIWTTVNPLLSHPVLINKIMSYFKNYLYNSKFIRIDSYPLKLLNTIIWLKFSLEKYKWACPKAPRKHDIYL